MPRRRAPSPADRAVRPLSAAGAEKGHTKGAKAAQGAGCSRRDRARSEATRGAGARSRTPSCTRSATPWSGASIGSRTGRSWPRVSTKGPTATWRGLSCETRPSDCAASTRHVITTANRPCDRWAVAGHVFASPARPTNVLSHHEFLQAHRVLGVIENAVVLSASRRKRPLTLVWLPCRPHTARAPTDELWFTAVAAVQTKSSVDGRSSGRSDGVYTPPINSALKARATPASSTGPAYRR